MFRYFIKLSFDGTNYHGWQLQDNANTVQAELEMALSTLLSLTVKVTGCGRTDTGVHAREYYAHFDYAKQLEKEVLKDIVYRMNAILPDDISVEGLFPVSNDLHARFSAQSRTYKYYISCKKTPFLKMYSWNVYGDLDMDKMNAAAAILFEYKDFTSFSKLHTDVKTNNCRIMQAAWTEEKGMLVFSINADRFLRNMVRAIVGTLLDVGKGKLTIDDFRKIIEGKNRSDAGSSVPARGLFLENIEYKWNADNADLI
jgi:tRNA pseudouridine38-40 synthase